MRLPNYATDKNRWIALIFIALGLAIVIIDNTVINVAIPYILRDLNTTLDSIEWVISGYALIIATLLITVGRLGDLYGRKRIFIIGTILFAVGSFVASLAPNSLVLFIGEALIEAVGASMMLTSSLSLLTGEFQGRERAIAFGVWGSVAGASAAIGPLLGGYLTAYYSWRWSLRINVIVAIIAIIGSVFIKEMTGEGKKFDFKGMFLSAAGLFSLVFGVIEGQYFGWWTPTGAKLVGDLTWPLSISIIPFIFIISSLFIHLFIYHEIQTEKQNGDPLLKISMFKNKAFSLGLITLGIVVLGQIGTFFVMPIYLQNVLGYDAFKTGLTFIPFSVSSLIFGPISGYAASKFQPKYIIIAGMVLTSIGIFLLISNISPSSSGVALAPAYVVFGIGLGMTSSQLTNSILSSVPLSLSGEASAVNATVRQIASSIGIALLGVILTTGLSNNITKYISGDQNIPQASREQIIKSSNRISFEQGKNSETRTISDKILAQNVGNDINVALSESIKESLRIALILSIIGGVFTIFLPPINQDSKEALEPTLQEELSYEKPIPKET